MDRRSTWHRLAAVHGLTAREVMAVFAGWLLSVGLAHIGIPAVDPALVDSKRPLETVGYLAATIPASLIAALLTDDAPWLVAVSPRGPRALRVRWVIALTLASLLVGSAWAMCLPADVPRDHSIALWSLLFGCAICASAAFGPNLAAVGPVLLIVPLSIGGLIPFGANLVYNVSCLPATRAAAVGTLALGIFAYVRWGDPATRAV